MLSKIQSFVWALVAVTETSGLRLDSTANHPMEAKAGRRSLKKFLCFQNRRAIHNKREPFERDPFVDEITDNGDIVDALCATHGDAGPSPSETQKTGTENVAISVYFPRRAMAAHVPDVDSQDLDQLKKTTVGDFLYNGEKCKINMCHEFVAGKNPSVYAAKSGRWEDISSELDTKKLSELVDGDMKKLSILVSPEPLSQDAETFIDLVRDQTQRVAPPPTAPEKLEEAPVDRSTWWRIVAYFL